VPGDPGAMSAFAELKLQADPARVAAAWGLDLRPSGAGRLVAWCPFHAEKGAPSLTVYTLDSKRPGFHCFGCGWSGSVLDFVAKRENLNADDRSQLAEAARLVAERLGLGWNPRPDRRTPEEAETERKEAELRTAALRAVELAAAWFERELQGGHEGARRCREYALGRGLGAALEEPLRASWRLGYAGESRQLIGWLEHHGIAQAARVAAGLTGVGDSGFEFLRGAHRGERLVIPIGPPEAPVAFTGRLLPHGAAAAEKAGRPAGKYVNTPESLLWKKREHLYGLPQAAPAIRRNGRAGVVEGHLDVVSAQLAGLDYLVGCQGSTLSAEQAELLVRAGCRDAVLYPDGDAWDVDPATGRAKWDFDRIWEICWAAGLAVRVGRI